MWKLSTKTIKNDNSHHFFGSVISDHSSKLTDSQSLTDHINNLLEELDVTCLGIQTYNFKDKEGQHGFTSVYLLAESHIAIHTWPEYKVAELDVYLCNYLRDNRKKCEFIFDSIVEHFNALGISKQTIERPKANSLLGFI